MLLLAVLSITLTGAFTAPPPDHFQNLEAPSIEEIKHQDTYVPSIDDPTVALPIAQDGLEDRTKREAPSDSRPYSAYRGRMSMNRYRYPLHKKRSYGNPESYKFDEELLDEEMPQEYSLFRERQHDSPSLSFSKRNRGYNLALAPYDLQAMGRMYQLGKRTWFNDYPVPEEQHNRPLSPFAGINADAYTPLGQQSVIDQQQEEDLKKITQYLIAKYSRPESESPAIRRRKRATNASGLEEKTKNSTNSKDMANLKTTDKPHQRLTMASATMNAQIDRSKRGFGDYFSWGTPTETQPQAKNDEDFKDFLTREYFKTIARSVGNRKKRQSRNHVTGLGRKEFLEYISRHQNEINNEIKELIHRNNNLQTHEKKKRKAVLDDAVLPYVAEALKLPEECPVLDHLMENCGVVSDAVGDEDRAFIHACLRHEVCYMCGSSVDVSGHECNALLSSALEATCASSSLDCLSAAGETYNILSKSSRYDEAGTCTYDPCVRELLENP